ncbi:isopentenyl-diphosphate Delta-isomerase [Pedobacter sp. P351]|uniref:isopentenyl-diphosphate Delta-isomerase n=1 Tax=Pedobacter superstes TaxID=3133441 RepID=UPI0030A57E92
MARSYVILVDENDQQTGVMEKILAHQKGLLHRAFSIFIINNNQEMLLQKRASSKYHSPGLWTNACCSHPAPDESTIEAANRRLPEEMGFNCPLTEIGAFTYRAEFENGLTEFEFDHVFVGTHNAAVIPNPEEVDEYKWLSLSEIDKLIENDENQFTVWFKLAYPLTKSWIENKSATTFLI